MTEGLRLRPVVEDDLGELERVYHDREWMGEFNWAGFRSPTWVRKQWQEDRLLGGDKSVLIIEHAGKSIGFVSWAKTDTGAASYCFTFGISLWPDARGQGHGTEAQQQLARYLFAHTQVNRIQAYTEIENLAEQRSLEKAGFIREAVLRGLFYRDGEWRDEVLYRMLRSELPVDDEPNRQPAEDRG